jgi:hypothetical protein
MGVARGSFHFSDNIPYQVERNFKEGKELKGPTNQSLLDILYKSCEKSLTIFSRFLLKFAIQHIVVSYIP